ncbi:unnamed protein product [Effrenium voratum]|nr:unnamed protein product [Effrenium voratum]
MTYTGLISVCGRWDMALSLLQAAEEANVQLDIQVYNAAIAASESHWQRSLALFRKVQLESLQVDTATYNAAMGACDRRGAWQHSLHLLEELCAAECRPNLITCNVAIRSCWLAHRGLQAAPLFWEMAERAKRALS